MNYDKRMLSEWFREKAELFIGRTAHGFIKKQVSADEVRKEFERLAMEVGDILEGVREAERDRNVHDGYSEVTA